MLCSDYLTRLAYHAMYVDNLDQDSFNFETNQIKIERKRINDKVYYDLYEKASNQKLFRFSVGLDNDNKKSIFCDQYQASKILDLQLDMTEQFDDDYSEDDFEEYVRIEGCTFWLCMTK